jgi:hypothetical protein
MTKSIKDIITPICEKLGLNADDVMWSWEQTDDLAHRAMIKNVHPLAFAFASTYMIVAAATVDDAFLKRTIEVMDSALQLALGGKPEEPRKGN